MWERLKSALGRPPTAEADVEPDTTTARTRETGGLPTDAHDSGGTTGVGVTEEYVGRVAGQDVGYAGETGAERRANP